MGPSTTLIYLLETVLLDNNGLIAFQNLLSSQRSFESAKLRALLALAPTHLTRH